MKLKYVSLLPSTINLKITNKTLKSWPTETRNGKADPQRQYDQLAISWHLIQKHVRRFDLLDSKWRQQENKARKIFKKTGTFLTPWYAPWGIRNVRFFGKFGVPCFLFTSGLRFTFLPCYLQTIFLSYCSRNLLEQFFYGLLWVDCFRW